MADTIRAHILVAGRVQGVFYRKGAQKKAQELGLTGWAHNTVDGNVEIVCEGEKDIVEEFVAWCKQGTSFAKVKDCTVEFQKHTGEFDDFFIREFGF